jgi:hypothetical protein
MIAETLKLIAENGPLLCTAYANLAKKERREMQKELTIRYMTDEEVMRYLISTRP